MDRPTVRVLARKAFQVKFLLTSPDKNLHLLIRDQRQAKVEEIRRLPLGELPVIFEDDVVQQDLELVGGKEAPRACMLPVSEADVLGAGTDEVCNMVFVGTAELHKSIWVKLC